MVLDGRGDNVVTLKSSPKFDMHPTRAELYAMGTALREKCPRSSHGSWQPSADRADPVQLLEQANHGRMEELIPIRYGRMLQSPFTSITGRR